MSNLYYYVNGSPRYKTQVKVMTFPGGEVGVNINTGSTIDSDAESVTIVAHLQTSVDVMALLMATEAIRYAFPRAAVDLLMPYIPYARQDRRCNYGEALSIKVFANMINSQDYRNVVVLDPHSNVSSGLLDRCHIVDQYDLFAKTKLSWHDTTIVAPDLGAVKKTEEFCKRVGARGVAIANKKRELATGKILGMEILGDSEDTLRGAKVVVLDDIVDGGRTFIELGMLLDKYDLVSLELYVTHGIFSKGVDVLNGYYDKIVTTNSFRDDLGDRPNLEVIDFKSA